MVGKGDIGLVKFPLSHLSQLKVCPAVILWVNPSVPEKHHTSPLSNQRITHNRHNSSLTPNF